MIRAFVQARLSSSRFPGKVLAPFQGRPVLAHVIERLSRVLPPERIVVATSREASDDPLAAYAPSLGVAVTRGSLDNVIDRLQRALIAHPAERFFRVCADSPLLDPELFRRFLAEAERSDADLVTNVHPRTFPRGRSVELLRVAPFLALDATALPTDEQEHVTRVYYNNPSRFRILNLESGDPSLAAQNLCVDTPEDLRRLEGTLR